MKTLAAKEAKEKFGVLIDQARTEPVAVTKHGRPAVIVISAERYGELEAAEDRLWLARATAAEAGELLSPEETASFLREKIDAAYQDDEGSDRLHKGSAA